MVFWYLSLVFEESLIFFYINKVIMSPLRLWYIIGEFNRDVKRVIVVYKDHK